MIKFLLPAILWTIVVVLLSLAPPHSLPEKNFQFIGADKVAHVVFYSLLTYFWSAGLKRQNKSKKLRAKAFYIAVIGGFLLGLILEVTQEIFIKNRYFESLDLIANGFGCIFGLLVFKLVFASSYK